MKSLVLLLLVASGWIVRADEVVNSNVPRIETIYSMSFTGEVVQIQVESNGCTSKESFLVQKLFDTADDVVRLLFVRIRPDWCRAFHPDGVFVDFSREDLGLTADISVRVENPFGYNPRREN